MFDTYFQSVLVTPNDRNQGPQPNEYTVVFDSKPFGMTWTATKDRANRYVSKVTPNSKAAESGVVPGSMVVALNGIDIQNWGHQEISAKAKSLGLPLRVTFRKPDDLKGFIRKQCVLSILSAQCV